MFGALFGLVGIGFDIAGMSETVAGAQAAASAQKQIAGLEIQQDKVRRQLMEVSAKRQKLEILRNAQRARAVAHANATSGGAQFGSGLQGGYGQIQGQAESNTLGVNQNLYAGEKIFDLNAQIDQQKMNLADAQSQMAIGQGLTSIGGALTSNAGTLGSLFG